MQQDFEQFGKDLESGNLSAAQQAYANIQQDFRSQEGSVEGHRHHHYHHHDGGGSSFGQLFSQLAQALQSGNLPQAQQAFATL